jgi:hypothetical protein
MRAPAGGPPSRIGRDRHAVHDGGRRRRGAAPPTGCGRPRGAQRAGDPYSGTTGRQPVPLGGLVPSLSRAPPGSAGGEGQEVRHVRPIRQTYRGAAERAACGRRQPGCHGSSEEARGPRTNPITGSSTGRGTSGGGLRRAAESRAAARSQASTTAFGTTTQRLRVTRKTARQAPNRPELTIVNPT